MSSLESDPLFPPDFAVHLRRFTRHVTAVQTRGIGNSSTRLLFTNLPPDHPSPPPTYMPAHDSYDLKNHPVQVFRPSLLVDNIERFFVSVIPLWSSGINEIKRLTTWREPRRTATWGIVYSICWWYELVVPTALLVIICLCIWPKSSAGILFPPEGLYSTPAENRPELTDPEDEKVAEAAAAAAETFIQDVQDSVPLVCPIAEVNTDMQSNLQSDPRDRPGKPSSTSSKAKESKPGRKNLSQQYKPVIYKYGGAIQNIAGWLCDYHERLRNLFTRPFIPPPPQSRLSPLHQHQGSDHSHKHEIDANVRFALPLIPLLFFSLILSTKALGRCVTFALGFAFFLLDPIQRRSRLVRNALDPEQTILRGVPTDRAYVLATLRNMQQRHDEGLDIAMKLLARPDPPKLPPRKRASDGDVDPDTLSSSSSGSLSSNPQLSSSESSPSTSPPRPSSIASPDRHPKLMKLAKKINRVTEQGNQILSRATHEGSQLMNGYRPNGFDISLLGSKIKRTSKSSETSSVKSVSRSQTRIEKVLRAINASGSANADNLSVSLGSDADSISSSHASLFNPESSYPSFFCYYGNMPGHLTIHSSRFSGSRPMLSFYSSLGQSFKARKSLVVIPLSRIVAMRKVSMLSLAGVWGGIDGVEIWEQWVSEPVEESDESSQSNHSRSSSRSSNLNNSHRNEDLKPKNHTFRNMTRRDEAFLRLLALKYWDENEEPGWISV